MQYDTGKALVNGAKQRMIDKTAFGRFCVDYIYIKSNLFRESLMEELWSGMRMRCIVKVDALSRLKKLLRFWRISANCSSGGVSYMQQVGSALRVTRFSSVDILKPILNLVLRLPPPPIQWGSYGRSTTGQVQCRTAGGREELEGSRLRCDRYPRDRRSSSLGMAHSLTALVAVFFFIFVRTLGIEPRTSRVSVVCSTSWAICAFRQELYHTKTLVYNIENAKK